MLSRKDFRVIEGGKGGEISPAAAPSALSIGQLRERAIQLRYLLCLDPKEKALGLVDDMEEAIAALQRLEVSSRADARQRAAEYRALIAEIDAEILGAMCDP